MREAALLRAAEKRLRERGILYRKRHGSAFSTAGDPDLYLLWRGIHAEIELKAPGRQPTPLQSIRLNQWKQAGALVFVAHSVVELDGFLDEIQA
jgi:hypothetical protein